MPTHSIPPRPLLLDAHVRVWALEGNIHELGEAEGHLSVLNAGE